MRATYGVRPWFLSIVAGCCACSGGGRPRLESCVAGWEATGPMFAEDSDLQSSSPNQMVWADRVLYESSFWGIKAVSENGLDPTTIVAKMGSREGIWVQGQSVLTAHRDELDQVPRTGGEQTTFLDGGQHNDPRTPEDHVGSDYLLDGVHFYWTTFDPAAGLDTADVSYIWRMPLAGGPVEKVGEVSFFVDGLALVADGVLAAGWQPDGRPEERPNMAAVLPFAGGDPRVLERDPDSDRFIAVDSEGAVWTRYRQSVDKKEPLPIKLSPADGSAPRLLSRDLPEDFYVIESHYDGRGGRFLVGWETFDDGLNHASVFYVTPTAGASRVACEPSGNVAFVKAPTLSPEALYGVALCSDQWQLVKIVRPVHQP